MKLLSKEWSDIFSLLILSFFINIFALTIPIFILNVYDKVIPHNSYYTLFSLTFGAVIFLIFDYIFRYVRYEIVSFYNIKLENIFSKESINTQSIISILDLPFATLFLMIILYFSQILGLTLIFVFILVAFINIIYSIVNKKLDNKYNQFSKDRERLKYKIEVLKDKGSNIDILEKLIGQLEDLNSANLELKLKKIKAQNIIQNINYLSIPFSLLFITSIGAIEIVEHNLSFGALIATNMLSSRFLQPMIIMFQNNSIKGFINIYKYFSKPIVEDRFIKIDNISGEISFKNLALNFNKNLLFRFDNFTLPANKISVVVSNKSVGKTTFLKLISKNIDFYSGEICFDGIDIKLIDNKSFTKFISMSCENDMFIDGTILDNLKNSKLSDEETILEVKKSGLFAIINNTNSGFLTKIDMFGNPLSKREKSAISILKALLKDSKIVLIDDTFDIFEKEVLEQLIEYLKKVKESRTIIVVSQNRDLISSSDYIFIFDNKNIKVGKNG